jgi:hypothetical protein
MNTHTNKETCYAATQEFIGYFKEPEVSLPHSQRILPNNFIG